MNRTLSVTEWHRLAEEGTAPPVRILLHGNSMFPLIRVNRDYVTVTALDGELVVGDIVLFADPRRERYVMHRVWEVKEDQIRTWGDNCDRPDAWLPVSAIWGKAVLIERGRRRIIPNPKKGMRRAKIWHRLGKVYRFAARVKNRIFRRNGSSAGGEKETEENTMGTMMRK
ncbi:MAG: hypothetical protein J5531_03400 [Lachnospiraceae bacterium]|nr:hypothetical protein [Lachnospiraceae bacterium]